MLGRKPHGRNGGCNLPYDDFQPSAEWVQDPSSYILLIQLPGFKKDDIRVIVDNNGRLTVRGTKHESSRFEQSYNAPAGSNFEKISAKFEVNCLALIIPKAATVEPEKEIVSEEHKEGKKEAPMLKEKAKIKEEKEEATQKVLQRIKEEKCKAPAEKGKNEEPAHQEDATMHEENKLDILTLEEMENLFNEMKYAIQKEMLSAIDKKMEQRAPRRPSSVEDQNMEPDKEDKRKGTLEERLDNKSIHCEKGVPDERIHEKESRKKWFIWDEEEDSGLMDVVLEKFNRNRTVFTMALAALSVGFLVSHKLRTREG